MYQKYVEEEPPKLIGDSIRSLSEISTMRGIGARNLVKVEKYAL